MKYGRIVALMVLMAMLGSAGCVGRAIREGYHGVVGAGGVGIVIGGDPAEIERIALDYGGYQLEPFTCDMGLLCDQAIFDALPNQIAQQLRVRKARLTDDEVPFFVGPDDRQIVIRGRVIHYETTDLLGVALGPMQEVIARVEILEADTGRQLLTANCVGRVESTVRTGPQEFAQGIARALRRVLLPPQSARREE